MALAVVDDGGDESDADVIGFGKSEVQRRTGGGDGDGDGAFGLKASKISTSYSRKHGQYPQMGRMCN